MLRLAVLCFILAVLLALYVGTYAAMSAGGRYHLMITKWVWQPVGIELRIALQTGPEVNVELNPLGYVFAPLLMLDHRYWHQHKPLLSGASPLRPSAYPPGFVETRCCRQTPPTTWTDGLCPWYPSTVSRRQPHRLATGPLL